MRAMPALVLKTYLFFSFNFPTGESPLGLDGKYLAPDQKKKKKKVKNCSGSVCEKYLQDKNL